MSSQSPEGVCNLALDKLGADPIASISAPTKPNEKLFARQFPHVRDGELRKHRWLFSMRVDRLTPTGDPIVNDVDGTLYQYQIPGDAVRAVRTRWSHWQRRGNVLLDPGNISLDVKFVIRLDSGYWDDLFTEAVAAKLAEVCCEKVTQSTDKKESVRGDYTRAIDEARRANALELGPDDVIGSDDNYSWLRAHRLY